MKKRLCAAILLLLAGCMLFSACVSKADLDPAKYGLPEDAQIKVRSRNILYVVRQQPEKYYPFTLPETEDFALISHAFPFFYNMKGDSSFLIRNTHVRYDGKYYICLFEKEWLYVPDEDGQYTLWKRKKDVFRPTKTRKSEAEVLAWFFTDLSEGSVSIAAILGVWGEPTGKIKSFYVYNYNHNSGPYNEPQETLRECPEYNFHGILQYMNPETGLMARGYSVPDNFGDAIAVEASLSELYYIDRDPYCWQELTPDGVEPVLKDK